ncbi:MAG: AAA family ATPase, partial [Rhodospirillaceae bacterium]|nr:AAA family ATPase [Rhodospirillaceae bacterium]
MTDPDTVSADYTLRPSELAATLALLVEARQPTILWGAPGCAKSALAQQVAAEASRHYLDVRALLLDPVDLRGIPWRDADGRTRWAPPAFLPPAGDPGRWLVNLEELPSAVPMVQAALYQLVLDR